MKKIAFVSVVFGILFLFFGCEKETNVKDLPKENPKFTLSISPEIDTVEVGDKAPITIETEGGDSITFRPYETATPHSYSRPAGLIGEWVVVDTLPITEIGLNQAFVDCFNFLSEDKMEVEVKNSRVDVLGYFPELYISAPSQVSWKDSVEITITSKYGDYIVSNIPGFVEGMLNGTFKTPPLDTTKTYYSELRSIRNNVVARNITITVAEPTREDTLSYKLGPLRIRELRFQSYPGGPWSDAVIPDLCRLDNLVYYYLNPEKTQLYDVGDILCYDGEIDATGYWHLESNGTVLVTYQNVNQSGYSYRDIEVLDEKTVILIDHYDNGQSTKTTYDRL